MRVIIDQLAVSTEDLATHGIMRPEALRGLDTKDTIDYAIESM